MRSWKLEPTPLLAKLTSSVQRSDWSASGSMPSRPKVDVESGGRWGFVGARLRPKASARTVVANVPVSSGADDGDPSHEL